MSTVSQTHTLTQLHVCCWRQQDPVSSMLAPWLSTQIDTLGGHGYGVTVQSPETGKGQRIICLSVSLSNLSNLRSLLNLTRTAKVQGINLMKRKQYSIEPEI